MKILIHDYAGHPFEAQLSRELAARGYEVLHAFAGGLQTPRGSLVKRADDPDSLRFESVEIGEPIEKYSFLKRRNQERKYAKQIVAVLERERPNVLISANTPSEAQYPLSVACGRLGTALVSWVQDIYGLAAQRILRKKIPLLGHLVGQYYIRLDAASARQSQAVVLISEDFRAQMHAWGVPNERMTVVPNWAPLDEMPVAAKDNPWAVEQELADKVCLMYSGTLAMKHNPELLLQLARKFRTQPDVRIVIVSEGRAVESVIKQGVAEGLRNLVSLPFQPMEKLSQVLATADVLIAVLEPDAGEFSVPSKVLSYLCAKRPLLLSVPLQNLAARTVTNANAGLVAGPNDISGFLAHAERLIQYTELRSELGRNGRRYAEANFQIEKIADRFEGIIDSAVMERGSMKKSSLA